jgi:hypothetical protein
LKRCKRTCVFILHQNAEKVVTLRPAHFENLAEFKCFARGLTNHSHVREEKGTA